MIGLGISRAVGLAIDGAVLTEVDVIVDFFRLSL